MRVHGRNGLVYLSVHAGDAASPLAYLNGWSVDLTYATFDVTAITDAQRTWAAGIQAAAGTFTGFWDDQTAQTYTAVTDGLPRLMFLYPDSQHMGDFFSGSVFPDLTGSGGTGEAVAIAANWVADGPVTRTGSGLYSDVYPDLY